MLSDVDVHSHLTIFYVLSDTLSIPTQDLAPSAYRIRQVSLYLPLFVCLREEYGTGVKEYHSLNIYLMTGST